MGDNHPIQNIRGFLEKALQRFVQGGVVDRFGWPYYGSITPTSQLLPKLLPD